MQSPRRLPLWRVPTLPPSVFGLGLVETEIFQHVKGLGTQANTRNISPWFQHQSNEKNQVQGEEEFRRFLYFCGDESGDVWFMIWVSS